MTDDAGITQVNATHLAKHEATDVISFYYEPIPGEDERACAELIVNVERAIEEGDRRKGWSASRELALYIAHGCDHFSGADDSTTAGRNRMRRRELRWLKDAPVLSRQKENIAEQLFTK